jgi:glyoxylase-like metal-dependent hydrolase (beta-lactamase superfamily II)
MRTLRFGDISVSKVVELEGLSFKPGFLLPDVTSPEVLAPHLHWLEPGYYSRQHDRFIMSMHSYVVRTSRHTILIDTCIGDDKPRHNKMWNMRKGTYLQDLAAQGVRPEEVDFVMCTHLHVDHVGWNTRLVDGRWVPAFPNARYVFAKAEYEHWLAESQAGREQEPVFTDSVLPVMQAGRADLVAMDHAIDDEVFLEPSPGHTPGHICINLASKGSRAVMTGDMMHHPIQIWEPHWSSAFCTDREASGRMRKLWVDKLCETDVTVFAAHFAAPTAGRVRRNGNGTRFEFIT